MFEIGKRNKMENNICEILVHANISDFSHMQKKICSNSYVCEGKLRDERERLVCKGNA